MRLQTEAFDYSPFSLGLVLLVLAGVVVVVSALAMIDGSNKKGERCLTTFLVLEVAFLAIMAVGNNMAGPHTGQLNADLKDQLGIEKVSYDDDYRELTGEKDGTVVFCVLAEEGDRGNIYEVICK